MNTVIVKTDLDTAKQYCGKSVFAKIKGKKNIAYFRVPVDDFSLAEAVAHAKVNKNILMLAYTGVGFGLKTFDGSFSGVNIGWLVPVGGNVTEEDIQGYASEAPEGVSVVLQFPSDYKNLEFMCKIMDKYPNVRVCGGCAFCFDDCRFGCCGRDILTRAGIKFDTEDYLREGCSCAVPVIEDSEVSLGVFSGKQGENKNSTKSATGAKKQKAQMFSSLLYGGGKVEL